MDAAGNRLPPGTLQPAVVEFIKALHSSIKFQRTNGACATEAPRARDPSNSARTPR
jgi:hypothetical protein